MALERWFPIAQPIEGQVAPQPISQQANRPLVARQRRKRKRVAKDRIIESGTPPTDQSPTTTTGTTPTPQLEETPYGVRPTSKPITIGSHMTSTSSTSSSRWECNFQLGDKVLPTDSYVWTWRNGLEGQVSDSLGMALLLLVNLDHYTDSRDEDIVLKLKWAHYSHEYTYSPLVSISLLLCLYLFQFYKCQYLDHTNFTLLSLSLSEAAQLTHVVEGHLKGMMEEVDKEKALKQVTEVSLNKKTLELNSVERQPITVERAQELAKQKVEDLQGKLEEAEVNLAKVSSIVSARDKELADLKETMKNCGQVFYNMGFKDTKNLAKAVIFQARRLGFREGWMAAINAIGLPQNSFFRGTKQIPLPNDLPIEVQADDQSEDAEEEEGEDNPGMRELSQQIDAHVVVIDEENQITTSPTETQNAPQSTPSTVPPVACEIPITTSVVPREPTT